MLGCLIKFVSELNVNTSEMATYRGCLLLIKLSEVSMGKVSQRERSVLCCIFLSSKSRIKFFLNSFRTNKQLSFTTAKFNFWGFSQRTRNPL